MCKVAVTRIYALSEDLEVDVTTNATASAAGSAAASTSATASTGRPVTVTGATDGGAPVAGETATTASLPEVEESLETLKEKARSYRNDAKKSADDAHNEATGAKNSRIAAHQAAHTAKDLCDHARQHAATAMAAADSCRATADELRSDSRSLITAMSELKATVEARANANAKAGAPNNGAGSGSASDEDGEDDYLDFSAGPAPGPTSPAPTGARPRGAGGPVAARRATRSESASHESTDVAAPQHSLHVVPVRAADEIAAAMSQLNTLLLGASPAFAQAMRVQTDAIASGLGALNAISNQQSHYALEIASTARAIVESHERSRAPGAGGNGPTK